jgi:ABC-2 type transport system permease protein
MKAIQAALWMEVLKVRRTTIFPISMFFFIFMGIMMGLLMFVSQHPEIANRSATISMKTSFLGEFSWIAYYSLLIQIILTVGVIGFGIITSWDFGREFSDRVVKDLLALPVPRFTIILAKLVILFFWSMILSVIVLVAAILTGLAVRIPGWTAVAWFPFLGNYIVCTVFNALLVTPVAFVASAGRGYLLPVSFIILIMILTQLLFVGLPGAAFWFPWALPALVSGVAGETIPQPGFISYLIYGLTVLAGLFGTIAWWQYADHK